MNLLLSEARPNLPGSLKTFYEHITFEYRVILLNKILWVIQTLLFYATLRFNQSSRMITNNQEMYPRTSLDKISIEFALKTDRCVYLDIRDIRLPFKVALKRQDCLTMRKNYQLIRSLSAHNWEDSISVLEAIFCHSSKNSGC